MGKRTGTKVGQRLGPELCVKVSGAGSVPGRVRDIWWGGGEGALAFQAIGPWVISRETGWVSTMSVSNELLGILTLAQVGNAVVEKEPQWDGVLGRLRHGCLPLALVHLGS